MRKTRCAGPCGQLVEADGEPVGWVWVKSVDFTGRPVLQIELVDSPGIYLGEPEHYELRCPQCAEGNDGV